jgi:hypothetical protein
MTTNQQTKHEYLGDGVHASWDGYYVWLSISYDFDSIGLEPRVLARFRKFCDDLPDPEEE